MRVNGWGKLENDGHDIMQCSFKHGVCGNHCLHFSIEKNMKLEEVGKKDFFGIRDIDWVQNGFKAVLYCGCEPVAIPLESNHDKN